MADRRRNGGWFGAIAQLPRWLWACIVGDSLALALGARAFAFVIASQARGASRALIG